MTLNDLCSLFDQYEIVDTQINIDRNFYAISEKIYTDGEDLKTNVNRDAYIHISSVHNANYLMFIDRDHKIFICIYKYISTTKYKEIVERLHILRNLNNRLTKCEDADDFHLCMNEDVIDINTFKCTECDSDEKLSFVRSKNNPDILMTKCNNCKTEYTFTPSKYYKMASKRIVYFKSENSSRDINLKEERKSLPPGTTNLTVSDKKQTVSKSQSELPSTECKSLQTCVK